VGFHHGLLEKKGPYDDGPDDGWYGLLFRREVGLCCAAEGADPIFRKTFESGSRLDAVVRISLGGIVDIPTQITHILFLVVPPFGILRVRIPRDCKNCNEK
jgi:hypothetical protein